MVELAAVPCPRWGEPGFLALGREADAVYLSSAGSWLTSYDCFHAVSDLADVRLHDARLLGGGDSRYQEAGSPRFRVDSDGCGATLNIELRYDPMVWPDEAMALQRTVARRLERPDVKIVPHPPFKLDGDARDY
jgi:hypothetical protein